MSWLATWFIFRVDRVGGAADLSEPQAFKNVSLQMMIDKTFIFRRIQYFTKNCTTFKFLTFNMNGLSGSGTLLPLPPVRVPLPDPCAANITVFSPQHYVTKQCQPC